MGLIPRLGRSPGVAKSRLLCMILEQQGHQSSGQTTQAIPPAQSTDPLLVLLFKEPSSSATSWLRPLVYVGFPICEMGTYPRKKGCRSDCGMTKSHGRGGVLALPAPHGHPSQLLLQLQSPSHGIRLTPVAPALRFSPSGRCTVGGISI